MKLFLRNHKYEIMAFGVNMVVAFISYYFFKNNLIVFLLSVFIFTASLFFVIYQKTREKDFYFSPLDKSDQVKNWVGRGTFSYMRSTNSYEVTRSHSGYIFPKTINWDDYIFEFSFKIATSTCGFILRARDLSNYIMMQIAQVGINPHIRIDGEWIRWNHNDPQANMTFESNLSLDVWYKAKVYCDKQNIRVVILDNDTVVFDRSWNIPEALEVTYHRDGQADLKIQKQIDFDFGAVGFRNHGAERAFVKNIFVEKL